MLGRNGRGEAERRKCSVPEESLGWSRKEVGSTSDHLLIELVQDRWMCLPPTFPSLLPPDGGLLVGCGGCASGSLWPLVAASVTPSCKA